jgi:hypothetical protein
LRLPLAPAATRPIRAKNERQAQGQQPHDASGVFSFTHNDVPPALTKQLVDEKPVGETCSARLQASKRLIRKHSLESGVHNRIHFAALRILQEIHWLLIAAGMTFCPAN